MALYTDILSTLHDHIFSPLAPDAFAALSRLAASAEAIQTSAVSLFPPGPFTRPKVELGARFGHLLGRHLGVCQLAQAMMGVVGRAEGLRAMAVAWDGVDFGAIKSERCWMGCRRSASGGRANARLAMGVSLQTKQRSCATASPTCSNNASTTSACFFGLAA